MSRSAWGFHAFWAIEPTPYSLKENPRSRCSSFRIRSTATHLCSHGRGLALPSTGIRTPLRCSQCGEYCCPHPTCRQPSLAYPDIGRLCSGHRVGKSCCLPPSERTFLLVS